MQLPATSARSLDRFVNFETHAWGTDVTTAAARTGDGDALLSTLRARERRHESEARVELSEPKAKAAAQAMPPRDGSTSKTWFYRKPRQCTSW